VGTGQASCGCACPAEPFSSCLMNSPSSTGEKVQLKSQQAPSRAAGAVQAAGDVLGTSNVC